MAGTSFYARIISTPNKIDALVLAAAISQNCADEVTVEQMENEFNLDTDESNSLQQVINQVCGDPPAVTIHDLQSVFVLAETGVAFNTVQTLMARLGVTL